MLAKSNLSALVGLRGLPTALGHCLEWLIEAEHRYRDAERLASLDDHLLHDIGITRDQASSEARRLMAPVPGGFLERQGS